MNIIGKAKLALQGNRAFDVIERESVNYDFRIGLAKGFGRLLLGAVLVSVPLFVDYFGNEGTVGAVLTAAGLTPKVASVIAVFLSAIARVASNYQKNK